MLRWTSRNGRSVATPKGSGSDSMRRLWHDSGSLWHDSGSLWLTLAHSGFLSETDGNGSVRERQTLWDQGAPAAQAVCAGWLPSDAALRWLRVPEGRDAFAECADWRLVAHRAQVVAGLLLGLAQHLVY